MHSFQRFLACPLVIAGASRYILRFPRYVVPPLGGHACEETA